MKELEQIKQTKAEAPFARHMTRQALQNHCMCRFVPLNYLFVRLGVRRDVLREICPCMGGELSGLSKKGVSRVIYDNSRDYAVSKYIMTIVEISLAYQLPTQSMPLPVGIN